MNIRRIYCLLAVAENFSLRMLIRIQSRNPVPILYEFFDNFPLLM